MTKRRHKKRKIRRSHAVVPDPDHAEKMEQFEKKVEEEMIPVCGEDIALKILNTVHENPKQYIRMRRVHGSHVLAGVLDYERLVEYASSLATKFMMEAAKDEERTEDSGPVLCAAEEAEEVRV